MNKNKIVFFDFDGVIVNTCPLMLEINQELLANMEFSELQKWAEGNIYNNKLRENLNEEFLMRHYFEQYSKRVQKLVPFEGMEEIFKSIIKMGYLLIIVSSASEEAINNFLIKYNLKKYFIEVLAKETHSSKVEKFKLMLEKYKIKAKETLMVTDSVGDVKEAMEVKIKTIGVVWGIHDSKKLKEAGADFIAEKPAEIVKGIKELLALS